MEFIKVLDSFSVAFAWFVSCLIICKLFPHKKFAVPFASIIFPLFFAMHYLTNRTPVTEDVTYERMVQQQILVLFIFLLFAVFVFAFFHLTIGEKFAVFGIHIATTLISEILLSSVMMALLPDASALWNAPPKVRILIDVLYFVINFILSLSILGLFKKFIIKLPWKIMLIILLIAISVISLFMLAVNPTPVDAMSGAYIYNTAIALISVASLVILIFLIIKFMIIQAKQNEEIEWTKSVQDIKIEHYSDIQNKIKEQRKLQHDFKDSISLIKVLVDSGESENIKKASDLMTSLLKDAEIAKIATYTENEIGNAVLSSKIKEAKESDIEVEAKINLPKELGKIDDYDMSRLFINLLNNAIEACQKTNIGNRKIRIAADVKANFIIIKVSNYCDSIKYDSKGRLTTSKKEKESHGLGLQIIKAIAEKYNGSDNIKVENNEFIHTVTLDIES